MAIVKDMKELPKDEPKLQKYTIYCLLVCLVVSIGMSVWYLIRMNRSSDPDISMWWSLAHLGGYIAYSVMTGLALFGAYYPKPQFLLWFLYGSLAVMIAEGFCLFWNQIVINDKRDKYSIVVAILKVAALIVFITSAVFAFLWKRLLNKQPSKQVEMANKNDEKVAAVKEAVKNGPKKEEKAGEPSKSDKTKSKA